MLDHYNKHIYSHTGEIEKRSKRASQTSESGNKHTYTHTHTHIADDFMDGKCWMNNNR